MTQSSPRGAEARPSLLLRGVGSGQAPLALKVSSKP